MSDGRSLWDLADEYAQLDELLDQSGGEITPEVEPVLEYLQHVLPLKVDDCAAYLRKLEAEAAAMSEEARHWREKAQRAERKRQRFREYLAGCLELVPGGKLRGRLTSIRLQENSRPSVRWAGTPETIPAAFCRTRVSWEVDTDRVLAAVKAGETLPEGLEVVHGRHVRIG